MARYFLKFRHSDTGLTPTFTTFKKVSDLSVVTPPTPVTEVGFGEYYFDYVPTFDITFEVDGGASIPTEEVRYIADTISPRDIYLDEPISQVKDDVWNDTVNRAASTKGEYVETIGLPADNSVQPTLFGKTLLYKESVKGADDRSITDIAGAGFVGGTDSLKILSDNLDTANLSLTDIKGAGFATGTDSLKIISDNVDTANLSLTDIKGAGFATGTDSLKIISDNVDAINIETDANSIANAVWDVTTVGNVGGGTMGGLLNDASANTGGLSGIANAVWDAATSAHTVAGSFGQTLQLEDSGLAQGAAAGTVTLKAGASAITDFYKNGLVSITSGTGVGQSRSITAYDGATKIATVDRNWGTNPIAGDGYIVLPAAPSSGGASAATIAAAVWDETLAGHTTTGSFGQTLQLADSGAAQAAAAGSITLKAGASAITDFYKNGLIVITSGTGIAQSRSITAYNGTTKVALIDRNWGTTPVAADGYMVLPAAPSSSLTNAGIADAVWDEALAGHLGLGSTGLKLNSAGGSGVSFLSNGDTVNPIIVQVSSPKFTQVKVTFSEPVVMTGAANGALNLANYNIPGLTLIAVSSLTSQQVLLTTSAQTPSFLYSLSVSNVEDLVGNPIV